MHKTKLEQSLRQVVMH